MMNLHSRLLWFSLKCLLVLGISLQSSNLAVAKSFDLAFDTDTSKVKSQDLRLLDLRSETDSLKRLDPPKKQAEKPLIQHRPAGKINLSFGQSFEPTINAFEEIKTPLPANLRPFIVNDDIVMLLKDEEFWLGSQTIQSKNYIIYKKKIGGIKTPDHDM